MAGLKVAWQRPRGRSSDSSRPVPLHKRRRRRHRSAFIAAVPRGPGFVVQHDRERKQVAVLRGSMGRVDSSKRYVC
jgi:hypothetical protein